MARKDSIEERRNAIAARKEARQAARRVMQYPLRLNASERAQLEETARRRGLSPADFLRSSFLDAGSGAPVAQVSHGAAPTPSLLGAVEIAALNRVGANINQIARRLNASVLIEPRELPEVLGQLATTLERIEAMVFASMDAR
jgi:hypothetical protein